MEKKLLLFIFLLISTILVSHLIISSSTKSINEYTTDEIFTKLVKNSFSISKGEAIFEIFLPYKINLLKSLNFTFNDLKNKIISYDVYINSSEIYKDISKIEIVKIEDKNKSECIDDKNKSKYDCSKYFTNVTYKNNSRETWVNLKDLDAEILGNYKIKLIASWKPVFGEAPIDWIPVITFDKEKFSLLTNFSLIGNKWAWWDVSYIYRMNISVLNETAPLILNNSNYTMITNNQTVIYGVGSADASLYFSNRSMFAIANDTDEFWVAMSYPNETSNGNKPANLTFFMPMDMKNSSDNITDFAKVYGGGGGMKLNGNPTYYLLFSNRTNPFGGYEFPAEVNVKKTLDLNSTTTPLNNPYGTLIMWIETANACSGAFTGFVHNRADFDFFISTNLNLKVGNTYVLDEPCNLPTNGGVHQLVVTWNTVDDKYTIWMDNTVYHTSYAPAATSTGVDMVIGGYIGTDRVIGMNLSHVEMYNIVLSNASIKRNYDSMFKMLTNLSKLEYADIINPSINITEPVNLTSSTNLTQFINITATDNVNASYCDLNITRGGAIELSTKEINCPEFNYTHVFSGYATYTVHAFVKDISGNVNYSSHQIEIISPVVPPVSSTAGGEGSLKNFGNWTMKTETGSDKYEIIKLRGVTKTYPLLFENLGDIVKTISLTCQDVDGENCNRIKFQNQTFNLDVRKKIKVYNSFTYSFPNKTTKDIEIFNIVAVDNSGARKELTVQLISRGPLTTFLVKLASTKLILGVRVPAFLLLVLGWSIFGIISHFVFILIFKLTKISILVPIFIGLFLATIFVLVI